MSARQTSRDDGLGEALALLRRGDLGGARATCDRLLGQRPRDPAVHQLAAAVALQAGDYGSAGRWAACGLERRPDHVPLLMIAARAARAGGDLRRALADLRRAATLAPDRADAAFLLCATLLDLGDGEARALLERLLRRFPNDADGWQQIGAALHKAGQPEAALAALTRAVRAAPSAMLQLRRGALLRSLGRLQEAIEAFRAARAAAPDGAEAALQLGLCLRETGDAEAACATLEQALALDPQAGRAWFALGLARQDKNDLPGAATAYRQALDRQPDLAEAAVNLGICLQEAGDLAAAKAAYRQALRLRPDTFGRIAQALSTAPKGELWLDLDALRRSLAA